MQFIDLKAQYQALQDGIDQRIKQVLEHGKFIMGPEVVELEERLADFCGVRNAITCANGTDALHLAILALGIGPGDAVFTVPFTFFATVEGVMLAGAEPVYVDVDARTYNMDPKRLEDAILRVKSEGRLTPRAVIAVDLFGLPADYAAIGAMCATHGLKLIEDAAQAFGGEIDGRRTCSFADIAVTSFFPAKPLGCYGDGGALFTDDDKTAAILRSLRVHGQGADKYDNVRVGLNSRLDTVQAAVLLEKLAAFPGEVERRQSVARRYTAALSNRLVAPHVPEGYLSVWAQYSVLAADNAQRTMLMEGLKQAGVPTMIYYSKPLHLQGAMAGLSYSKGDFPVSEDVACRIFSLPMHPYMSDNNIATVTRRIGELLASA